MDTLYDLYKERTKYKNLRENVINAINVLSRNSVSDVLSSAVYSLNGNYTVNEVGCKTDIINKAKESLTSDLSNLNVCLSSINSKIYSLDQEIEEKEAAGAAN